jgi:hypothetical protein
MLRAWRKKDKFEGRLRAHRAEPRNEFFDDLVRRASPNGARGRFRRPALAAALTVVLLVTLAGLGGVSYASFTAPITVIKKLALPTSTPHHTTGQWKGDNSHPQRVDNHQDGRDRDDGDEDELDQDNGDEDELDQDENPTSGNGQYGFTICHIPLGNPANEYTITVGSIAAVIEHLRHGDHLGPC